MPTCLCVNCSTELEFEASQTDQTIACPSCGLDTLLYYHPEPAAPAKTPDVGTRPASGPPIGDVSTRDHLISVRKETCYKELRSVLTFVFGVWAAISGLMIVGGLFGILAGDPYSAMFGVGGGLLSVILCSAGWQACILLIDIADLLIHIGRRSR